MSKLLSVVVPFHNVDGYLDDALASIAVQTYRNLEVILVDDGSTDDSTRIAEAYAQRDGRFRLVRQAQGGPSRARNVGIRQASGDFLAFVDGDDLLPLHAYRTMMRTAEHTGSDIVAGGVSRLASTGAYPSRMHSVPFADTVLRTHIRRFRPLIRDVTVWNKVYRRSIWTDNAIEFPEDLLFSEDAVGTLAAYTAAAASDVIRVPVYYWRVRDRGPQSLTQRIAEPRILLDRITAVSRISAHMAASGEEQLQRTWQDWSLRHHMRLMIDMMRDLSPEQRRPIMDAVTAYLATVPESVVERLLPRPRQQIRELAGGRLPGASAAKPTTPASAPKKASALSKAGALSKAKALGKKAARGSRLITHIDDVVWQDARIVIRGRMALFSRTGDHLPRVGAQAMWLREVETSRRSKVQVRLAVLTPTEPGGAEAAFEVRLNPAELKVPDQGSWRAGTWVMSLNVAAGRNLSRAVLGPSAADRPVRLPSGWRLDEYTSLEPRINDGRLELRLIKGRTAQSGVTLTDGTLRLTTRLSPPIDAASVCFGRVDGITEYAAPARVTPDTAGVAITAEIDIDRVAELIAPTDPTPVGAVPDRWQIWVDADGTAYPAVGNDHALRSTDAYVAEVHTDEAGRLAVTVRPSQPATTAVAWQPGADLVISGSGAAGADDRIVLRLLDQQEEHEWPVTAASGSWTARISPARVASLAGPLPLRRGTWSILYRRGTPEGPVEDIDLPVDPASLRDALDVRVSESGRTYWLSRGTTGLCLACAPEQGADDTHPAKILYQRDVHYPYARRSARLRDAVFYASFVGRQYSDSPRAVHAELVRRGVQVDHLWDTRDGQVALPEGTVALGHETPAYFEALATSKYLVVNNHLPQWFRRREGQIVVQTWHGTPLKKLGFDVLDNQSADKNYLQKLAIEVPQWSYLISPNSFSTPHLARAFRYEGEILEIGYPRNDVLASAANHQAFRARIAERLGIPSDKKIILYAPTWRDNEFYGAGRYKLTFQLDTTAAARALGDDYVLLVRRHPSIVDDVPGAGDGFVYDVSTYPDMADLLAAADVLVTDYSSVMFDFAVTGRPIIFFAYDLEFYRDSLRGFYFDFEATAPGPILLTSGDVISALADIDTVEAANRLRYQAFRQRFCDFDDGKATARLIDRVFGS